MLLHKTNVLADDIQGKVEKLDTVVHAVKDVGNTIQDMNDSLRRVTTSISSVMVRNQDKVAQVVQWGAVAKELKDKWFGEKNSRRHDHKPFDSEVEVQTSRLERSKS